MAAVDWWLYYYQEYTTGIGMVAGEVDRDRGRGYITFNDNIVVCLSSFWLS